MGNANLIQAITAMPALYIALLAVLILFAMYLARKPFHRSMASLSRVIYNAMRLSSASVKTAEKRLQVRNREVLLTAGLEHAERKVEREFDRLSTAVQQELENYPQMQRKVSEDLLSLEDDYKKSAEIPQELPDWVKVIDAIANIKPSGDRMVINMLEDIHTTLKEQHKTAVERHRRDVAQRHNLLSRMLPMWRGLQKVMTGVQKQISTLNQRSKKIDRYMDNYEKIRLQTDTAERQLSSSSLTQFFISGLVLAIAMVGAIINFNLIALPMSEMVGGGSSIGPFRIADVAGMFIVSLEIVLGVFLMDTIRITRLFSIFGSMDDRKRKLFFWVLLSGLTILAGVESALAFMRDRIAADTEALRQTLSGIEQSNAAVNYIPTIGQMIMGFILPFILTFVAIPFESFVSSARTVLGLLAGWGLRALAFLLRLIGNLGYYAGRIIINIYDLIIFPALWLEGIVMRKLAKPANESRKEETGDEVAAGQSNSEQTEVVDETVPYQ